jgi:subtilase family serine protease
MIRRLSIFLGTCAMMLAGVTVFSSAEPQPLLTHHVRDVVLNGQTPLVGKLPATQLLRVDIVLAMQDRGGLGRLLRDVYDPSNPLYRHFLTVEQFTQRFGPSQEQYDALRRFATQNRLGIVGGSRDAMDLQLQASVAELEAAFHTTINIYHDPIQGRDFYATDREPGIDLPFRLWHISGLDNYSIPRPLFLRRPFYSVAHPLAQTGSCPANAFCGSDMRGAYYEGTTLTGKGQNIGLLEYAGYDITDLNTYYANAKQTRTAPVDGISTDGTPLQCLASEGCDDTEQTIDMTQALGMAPNVTALYVFVGSTDTALLGSMASHQPLPLNLSSSWSWGPPDPNTDDPYFERMAAQGQSYFQAAGDGGAWEAKRNWWPMESQYVISVGGTDLVTKGPGEGWASETVWIDGGGGISPDGVPIPSWQQLPGVITTANEGSTTYRNGPDVSANSNFSFYVCADQTTCSANEYGGTSFAAPMWAGYLALANEQAAGNGSKPPGFINPTIYPLGLGSGYGTAFHDITVGTNGFPATKGYDLASGWGSPNTDGLINSLAP